MRCLCAAIAGAVIWCTNTSSNPASIPAAPRVSTRRSEETSGLVGIGWVGSLTTRS